MGQFHPKPRAMDMNILTIFFFFFGGGGFATTCYFQGVRETSAHKGVFRLQNQWTFEIFALLGCYAA